MYMSAPRISTEFDPFTLTVAVTVELSTGVTLQIPLAENEVDEFLDDLSTNLDRLRTLTKE